MRARTLFPIGLLAFVALLLGLSSQYQFKAALFPWLFGSITALLLGVQIWREIAAARKTETAKVAGPKEIRPFVMGIAWLVGILPMIYLLGFLVGLPIYCFLYFKLHGQKWLRSTVLTLLITAVIYGGFIIGLKVPLYKGLLFLALR